MFYFDAHCHLLPRKQFIKASNAGINYFICNATHPQNWHKLLDIASTLPGIYPCIGIHPWYIADLKSDWQIKMQLLFEKYPHLMVGEIGLDTTRPNLARQAEVFEFCLKTALKYHRSVHIHGHESWSLITDILKCYPGLTCLFHRFSGTASQAKQLSAITNAYFSLMSVRPARYLPAERILVESDSPDGLHKPARVIELAERIGLDWAQLDANFCRFLGETLPMKGDAPHHFLTMQDEPISLQPENPTAQTFSDKHSQPIDSEATK